MPIGAAKFAYQGYQVAGGATRTPKTLTNSGVTFTSGTKQFGTYSASFDGTNDIITGGIISDFAFTTDYTVECWINTADVTAEQISYHDFGTARGWSFGLRSSQRLLAQHGDNSTISVLVASTGGYTENTWQHIAMCYDASANDLALFANGSRVGLNTNFNTISAPTGPNLPLGDGNDGLRIGFGYGNSSNLYQDSVGGTTYYAGYMDELRISTVDRYGVNNTTYTVPTAAFTNDADTVLLMHFENNVDDDGG